MGFFVEEPSLRKQPLPEVVEAKAMTPETLEVVNEWYFLRFPVAVAVSDATQAVRYQVMQSSDKVVKEATMQVPARSQEWNVMAYSCYDQRRAVGEALWKELQEKAASGKQPLHVILGGGDQLYNDNVWATDVLSHWLDLSKEDRLKHVPEKEMIEGITQFYLGSYLRHINFHPAADLLAMTPQLNTWDDHDIFDGYGSYPEALQSCATFRAVFEQAQRFYLLGQHGTTAAVAAEDGYVVTPPDAERNVPAAYTIVSQLGPGLAVVAPDTRSQRKKDRIMSKAGVADMKAAMDALPKTLSHVILLAASPVVYPSLGIVESLLKGLKGDNAKFLLLKTGLFDKVMNAFGEPDLLDDITDHWSSSAHEKEKGEMLDLLAAYAAERKLRCSIVSGDVHLAAVSWTQSKDKAKARHQAKDNGFIPQIVTSGIGNNPPGNPVVKYIETNVKAGHSVSPTLSETVAHFFKGIKTPTGSPSFNNRMNYCFLRVERDATSKLPPSINFELVFLGGDQIEGKEVGDRVAGSLPPLLPQDAPAYQAAALQMDSIPPKKGCLCC